MSNVYFRSSNYTLGNEFASSRLEISKIRKKTESFTVVYLDLYAKGEEDITGSSCPNKQPFRTEGELV